MLKALTKKRLLKLADFLETKVPTKSFDLNHFVQQKHNCGAVCCAVGWMPACMRSPNLKIETVKDFNEGVVFPSVVFTKDGDEHRDWDAAAEFLELAPKAVDYLFNPRYYHRSRRGRLSVVDRIRRFVKNDGDFKSQLYCY